jgi:hypothetical protein
MFDLRELKFLRNLNSPQKIQDFLNSVPINLEKYGETLISPRRVLRDMKAHCMEGALFAAATLWVNGEKPLLMDIKTTKDDMEHVVALFKRNGRWGAISKTNHVVLRYREPVYKSVRELAMSYFHEYFLDSGKKTMRSFSKPFDLRKFGKDWITAEEDLWYLSEELDKSPHENILTPKMIKNLRQADPIERRAGRLTGR